MTNPSKQTRRAKWYGHIGGCDGLAWQPLRAVAEIALKRSSPHILRSVFSGDRQVMQRLHARMHKSGVEQLQVWGREGGGRLIN